MKLRFLGLEKSSNKILKDLEKAKELKKLANKTNYEHKVKKLKERLTEEFKFWMSKGPSPRLNDIEKDVKIVASLQGKTTFTTEEKTKINLLTAKYPID